MKRSRKPAHVLGRALDDVNELADWYIDKLLFTGPMTTYSVIGVTFYGLGYLGGKWITGAKIGGRVGAAASMKVWRDLQVGAAFTLARHVPKVLPYVSPLATGMLIHEGVKFWLGETDRSAYREPTTQERIDAYTTIPQYDSKIDAYSRSHYGRV